MSAEQRARDVFAAFQAAVDTWQAGAVADRFSDDVVYLGTGCYSRGRDEVLAYVEAVFAANDAMRWHLTAYDVFLDAAPLLGFAAEGEIVGVRDGEEQRMPFRVSVVAEQAGDDWLIRHFHGSVPFGAFAQE